MSATVTSQFGGFLEAASLIYFPLKQKKKAQPGQPNKVHHQARNGTAKMNDDI